MTGLVSFVSSCAGIGLSLEGSGARYNSPVRPCVTSRNLVSLSLWIMVASYSLIISLRFLTITSKRPSYQYDPYPEIQPFFTISISSPDNTLFVVLSCKRRCKVVLTGYESRSINLPINQHPSKYACLRLL